MSEIVSENKVVEKTQADKVIPKRNEVGDEPEKRIIYLASELPGVPEVINLTQYDTFSPCITIFGDEADWEANASFIYQDDCKTQRLRPISGSSLDSKIPKEKDKTTFQERLSDKKNRILSRAIFLINLFFLKKEYSNFFMDFRNLNSFPELVPEDVFQAKVLNLTKFNRNKLLKKHGISEAELNFIAFARFRYPFITRGEEEWVEIEKNAFTFIKRGWLSEDIRGNFKINVGNVYEFRDSIIFPKQLKEIVFKKVSRSKTLHKILRNIERSAKTQVYNYNISQISKLPFTQFGNTNSTTHPPVGKNDLKVSKSIKKEPICFTKDLTLKLLLKKFKKTETFSKEEPSKIV